MVIYSSKSVNTRFDKGAAMMRKINIDKLDTSISKNKKKVNEQLAHERKERKKRNRTRSQGEREALDQIAISRWKKAIVKGHVRKISDREFYYDHRTVDRFELN